MALNIWVRCIIALSGSLRVISAVMRSCPGDLLRGNVCMNDLTSFGVNNLGGRVIGSHVNFVFNKKDSGNIGIKNFGEVLCVSFRFFFIIYRKTTIGFFNWKRDRFNF